MCGKQNKLKIKREGRVNPLTAERPRYEEAKEFNIGER